MRRPVDPLGIGGRVVIRRGEVCGVDFGVPRGSAPAPRRPVVVDAVDAGLRRVVAL